MKDFEHNLLNSKFHKEGVKSHFTEGKSEAEKDGVIYQILHCASGGRYKTQV
jgi:hypothetical protein